MKNNKLFILILSLSVLLLLSSCSKQISDSYDELTASNWSTTLENDNEIYLKFVGDEAILSIIFADKDSCTISGFCEVSDTDFVIHDSITNTPFAFEYIVYFDRVELIYNGNTVSLYKT